MISDLLSNKTRKSSLYVYIYVILVENIFSRTHFFILSLKALPSRVLINALSRKEFQCKGKN